MLELPARVLLALPQTDRPRRRLVPPGLLGPEWPGRAFRLLELLQMDQLPQEPPVLPEQAQELPLLVPLERRRTDHLPREPQG